MVQSSDGEMFMQASADQLKELRQQLPKLEVEAQTASTEMQAAQQQAQDPGVTDEEREQLMERIPVLTNSEADLAQRLQGVREVWPIPGVGAAACFQCITMHHRSTAGHGVR